MSIVTPMPTAVRDQASLAALDRAHYMHGYHLFDEHRQQDALQIGGGDGAYIQDLAGNRYLDAVGGMWCTNIGLGREEMVEAIAAQTRQLAYANPFCDMANPRAVELCAKLAELAPGDIDHVFLTTGGSTAVDTAIRLVHYYQNCRGLPHKKQILTRRHAYHGSTYLGMSLGGKQVDREGQFDFIQDGIHHLSGPYPYRAPAGLSQAEYLESLVAEFEAKVLELGGAVVYSPGRSSGRF